MQNASGKKYSEIVEQCKQALTVIILNADIIGSGDGLSPGDEKCLKKIKDQAWRINRELKKGEGMLSGEIPGERRRKERR